MSDKTVSELPNLPGTDLSNDDLLLIWNTLDGTTRHVGVQDVLEKGRDFNQGYYALLTGFYFENGVATETEITDAEVDTWLPVNFDTQNTGTNEGVFDYRPLSMKEANADPYNDVTQEFTLEGLTLAGNVNFRASMTFEPDEDEGQLDVRLDFQRHSGTTPSENFQIEDVALTMNQGADEEYPAEPLLTFFVGDTIDTNGDGDSGIATFQVKSSVPGTLRMRALTWYISS